MGKRILLLLFSKAIVLCFALSLSGLNAAIIDTELHNQKVVQIAVTDIPISLSPYATDALQDQFSHLFFDPLVRWGQERKLEYRLLAKLKTINKNKTRFYLKKNIYFHSGNVLTSKDVQWSFQQALNNKYLQRKLQHKIKITPVNRYQLDIETSLTQPQLLDYLTHLFVLDSAYYQKNKIEHNVAQSALSPPITSLPLSGTGPYQVASYYSGVNLRVQANTHYWQNQPMYKTINFVKIKSPESRLYALLADDIDISESVSSKNINSVNFLEDKNVYQARGANALFLTVNELNNDLFNRQTARNAIHLAINQSGILKHILYGTGGVYDRFRLDTSQGVAPVYDAKRAKYLLGKIGAPKKMSLLVKSDPNSYTDEVAFALINMFKKVDIQLKVIKVETEKEWNLFQFNHDFTLSVWQSDLVEEGNVYHDIFSNSLLSGYINAHFNKQKRSLTMNEKIMLFEGYQLSDYIMPLFSRNKVWANDKQFDLQTVFSVNAIPYWHLLTVNKKSTP
ncbi:hypothetical protein CW745_02455 [Psychromonas sp. psych-6C06]|uniref:ABC transporter substrate-binding protein n=1 Tax=Psychromonas sp. psych-6C06 TaxID=2058089 RepID=UPI000C33FA5E|nr:ABC transporter substrate-binding protein [Psychromonas sp. psych-6C06]PKF63725.1 hypothetical protein CW745_02455 [Psychromonas sp. psych-6C06]